MKIYLVMLMVPVMSITAQVQNDSIKKKTQKAIMSSFSSTRFLDLQYEQFSESDYDSDLYDKAFEKGTIKSQKRFKAAVNIPIIKKKKWVLSGSLRYKFESFEFENVQNFPTAVPAIYHSNNEDFHTFATGVNFTYFSTLFGKTFIYNASIIADGSDNGFERVNGLLIGSLILKRTESTTITTGLLLQTNNTSISPILPVLSFEHQFRNSAWKIDLVLPKYIYFRRPLFDKGRLSLGTSFDGELFYTYPNQDGLKEVYSYSRNEVKTGFVYEYQVNKRIIATFRGGLSTIFSGQLRERGQTDEIIKTKQDRNGYFNVGISFNPFK